MERTIDEFTRVKAALESGDHELQVEALRAARSLDPLQVFPVVLSLFANGVLDVEVQREVLALLVDVREPEFVQALGGHIREASDAVIRQGLLSLCWQNPLDFSSLLPLFVESLLDESLSIVIEAFTALETALDHASPEQLRTVIGRLKAMEKERPPLDNLMFVREGITATSQMLQQIENEVRASKRGPSEHSH